MSGRCLLRLPLGGFSVDVHVACDDRISLYPAAPFRLATLLHAWTITQVGRGSSLVRQTGWPNLRIPITATPPTRPTPRRSVGTIDGSPPPVALPAGERGALRYEALFKEAPQRDRQFARNRNDHDASDTPALPGSSLHKPAGNRALFGWCLSQSQAAWIMVPRT